MCGYIEITPVSGAVKVVFNGIVVG